MRTLRMTLAVAGLFLAGPLFAQEQAVQATVPFSFYVGNSQLMPSGTYKISQCTNAPAVVVRNCNEGIATVHVTQPADKVSKDNGKLVFHKYGDTYFLNEIQGPSLSTGLVLPIAKNEKKLQEDKATVTTFETVTVPKPHDTK